MRASAEPGGETAAAGVTAREVRDVTDEDDGPPVGYPPQRHVLRDLAFEIEAVDPTSSRAHLPVVPGMCQAGRVSAGPLMTVVDVLAGSLVGRVVAPDWMATADLSLHLADPPAHGTVVVDARVLRDGRTTIVVEAALTADDGAGEGAGDGAGDAVEGEGRSFGEALLTFARLPRRDTNLDMSSFEVRYGERSTFSAPGDGLREPFASAIGVEVEDARAGAVRVEVTDHVRNSFGAVNGGVVASVAAEAAVAAASDRLGGPTSVSDAVVHYLTQGKVGPIVTAADVVRVDPGGALVRVEVVDTGVVDDGRPRRMVVAHVRCAT
jgi:acyl-coenzyme A thioesterase PaaI-like protein